MGESGDDKTATGHAAAARPRRRRKKPLMPDRPVTLEGIPQILKDYNLMTASRVPRERVVMKALLLVWEAYCREREKKGAAGKGWADKVNK